MSIISQDLRDHQQSGSKTRGNLHSNPHEQNFRRDDPPSFKTHVPDFIQMTEF